MHVAGWPETSDHLASIVVNFQSTPSKESLEGQTSGTSTLELPTEPPAAATIVTERDKDILPRLVRQANRPRSERGLPADEELARLAKAYSERQPQLWPKIAAAGLLPEPDKAGSAAMVESLKERHRTGKADHQAQRVFLKYCDALGGNYKSRRLKACHMAKLNA